MSSKLEYLRKLFSFNYENNENNESNKNNKSILSKQNKKLKKHKFKETKHDYKLIGKYKIYINNIIGQGSFATILLGKNIETGELVAVKKINNIRSIKKRELLKREIIILRKLNHPNVIKLYDVELDNYNDTTYLFMEYCDNGDLKCFQNKKKFHEYKALVLARQIKNALLYLYENNILHRDLKPHNILLDDNYNIKLTDFGFAKETDYSQNDILEQTYCGSPLYMSPELLNNNGYNTKSDIWSFGVILYELISGTFPFFAKSIKELSINIKKNEFKIPLNINNEISKELSDLLYKIFDKNVDTRINWIDIFKHEWFADTFFEEMKMIYYNDRHNKYNKINKINNNNLQNNTEINNTYNSQVHNESNNVYNDESNNENIITNFINKEFINREKSLFYSYIYIDENGKEIKINEKDNYILYNNSIFPINCNNIDNNFLESTKNNPFQNVNEDNYCIITKNYDSLNINYIENSIEFRAELENAKKDFFIDEDSSKIFIPLDDNETQNNSKKKIKNSYSKKNSLSKLSTHVETVNSNNNEINILNDYNIKNQTNKIKSSSQNSKELNDSNSVQVSNFVLYVSDDEDE